MSRAARRAMVRRPDPELSLSRQCRLLSIGRSWLCTLCLCRFFRVLNSDQFVQSFLAPPTCSYYLYGVPVWTFP